MDLKSGRPLWTAQPLPGIRYPPLRANAACDVVVIGAGISGTLVAHELVRTGQRVIVVDQRAPGAGSTSASTALLLYETDHSLAELARRHGRRAAIRTYELGRRAIREIGGIVRGLKIACDFRARNSLYLASDRRRLAQIRREYQLRRRTGLPVTLLDRHALRAKFGLAFPGALHSPGAAEIDVLRFVRGLLAHHAKRRALRIFQHTKIVGIDPGGTSVRVRTANGRVITAGHVVVATGYEAAPFLKTGLVQLHSTYVVASRPLATQPAWADRCLIWETARPYHYLRTTTDGRVLIGGRDEPVSDPRRRDAKLPAKARALVRDFRKFFPAIKFEREFAWCGTFAESGDGLPYIGALKSSPRILYALGYGGNGITFSQIAAKILGRLCAGRSHRDTRLFGFDRQKVRRSGTERIPMQRSHHAA